MTHDVMQSVPTPWSAGPHFPAHDVTHPYAWRHASCRRDWPPSPPCVAWRHASWRAQPAAPPAYVAWRHAERWM